MDHIKIKGGNGSSLQNRTHAAYYDHIDGVPCETLEDGQKIRFGFFHGLSL